MKVDVYVLHELLQRSHWYENIGLLPMVRIYDDVDVGPLTARITTCFLLSGLWTRYIRSSAETGCITTSSVLFTTDWFDFSELQHCRRQILNFSNPLALLDTDITRSYSSGSSLFSEVMQKLTLLAKAMVQMYFTTIIFKLCRKAVRWWLAGTIAILTATHIGFGLVTAIPMFVYTIGQAVYSRSSLHGLHRFTHNLVELEKNIFIEVVPYAASQVISDIAITVSLTNTLLNTLTVYAIDRCVLTSVVALVAAIAVIVKPESFWVIAIEYVIGKLYINSLLATLNARNGLRGGSSSRGSSSISGVISVRLGDLRLPADAHVASGGLRRRDVIFENRARLESLRIVNMGCRGEEQ
ncbi:hypothetical protein EW146_g8534 [Bondarzewia mesenterica]|uniref:DUF6534 domain-containing protein n=1 Tax=Bondarzewia mesenterica TaxID=1095465 RepID=A0A4S4LDM2_9AGAM|nr:hypothetical protein EW146_g8534 [Bondarzewia mesenterica]